MGAVSNVSYDRFPKQGVFLGRKVLVCFNFDPSRALPGEVVRNDAEEPGKMIIKLDDGRYVLSTECMYQPVKEETNTNLKRIAKIYGSDREVSTAFNKEVNNLLLSNCNISYHRKTIKCAGQVTCFFFVSNESGCERLKGQIFDDVFIDNSVPQSLIPTIKAYLRLP